MIKRKAYKTSKWVKPILTVLTRPNDMAENVLSGCKWPYLIGAGPVARWNEGCLWATIQTYCSVSCSQNDPS